ncbi:rod shape-determining protein MreD [Dokdonella koreensis]|uniref:Rod shape-determining protein MreD n=1 Tax=Dokdonella koreensis DS-123 TaxID=1300342 RepID=A0A160DW16_9GAMM|nr:rod shape-determining protein MreD [Dokdonella koreensis]ANB18777.1 Rod shape-determining protein MreD [Dokdonella koreensis DS-123]
MNRARAQGWLFAGSIALAMLLQLMPLPAMLLPIKPYWLALVLVYWAIETPDRVGLGFAFLLGLAGDVLAGQLLGEHALRLTALAFIVLRFRARLRFFPVWQQTLAVLALLFNDRIVVLMVRGFSGDPMPPATFWLSPLVGATVWPFVFILLDDLRSRLRGREA